MPRLSSACRLFRSLFQRPRSSPVVGPKRAAPRRRRLLRLEVLEDRTLPAVTFFGDPDNAGKFVVQFTEDVPGASDTLLLRAASGGQLEYQLNGAPFTTDLNSATSGVQPLAFAAISRIDVSRGGGADVLSVDGSSNPAVIPAPSGIVFAAGVGTDTLAVTLDANLTLTATTLTATGGR